MQRAFPVPVSIVFQETWKRHCNESHGRHPSDTRKADGSVPWKMYNILTILEALKDTKYA